MFVPSQAQAAEDGGEPGPFDLEVLLERITDPCRDTALDRDLVIAVLVPPAVPRRLTGDADAVAGVLGALVERAVRCARFGRVVLRVAVAGVNGADVDLAFTVEDAGPAIPAVSRACLLAPASHHDPASARCQSPSGSGGPLCRRICELPRLGVGLAAVAGEGVAFRLVARFTALPPAAPPPPGRELASVRPGARVLLVEDNEVNMLMTSRLLARLGCRVDCARAGAEALGLFAPGRYDLVLMDCEMPGMDGFEATRAIRAREPSGRVPIVALTAYVAAEERSRCLAAGMDDHLAKPFRLADLARMLARWVAPEAPVS